MKKKLTTTFLLVVIALIISLIGWFLEYSKVSSLSFQIENLESELQTKTSQIESLQSEIKSYQSIKNEIEKLNKELGNYTQFIKLIEKGERKLQDAFTSGGYAQSDYDDASRNYEANYFDACKTYADSCDAYYGYAYNYFLEAKGYFEHAKEYAPNDKLFRLAELYMSFSDYGEKITNEMHQACEYFSSACDLYSKGLWESGSEQIDKMNEHIGEHDRLVTPFNERLSQINALIETLGE